MNVPTAEDRLPRGPHRLTREEVAQSQRGRLYIAALDAVAEHGYRALTVADLVSRAKISRRTFYELFDSKEACFAAAFEVLVEVATGALTESVSATEQLDWRELVRTSLTTYLRLLAAEPAAARTLHVEAPLAGAAFADYRRRLMTVFAGRMRAARDIAVAQGELRGALPDEVFEFLIGGIDDRIRDRLLTHGPETLGDLAPTLCHIAVTLLSSEYDG
ncbi:TetR/AcrR family transcriptional regulator [Nocardia sp. NPDC055321]